MTGCNHHSVGMRGLSNWNTGYPNCTGSVSKSAATIAEVLRPTGYATFAVGKWQPDADGADLARRPVRPVAAGAGFDRYYGFMEGETDQWYPDLTSDNHPVMPPKTPDQGYHLSEDLIDQAIGMVRSQKAAVAAKPFFLYVAFGATHAPHQAPKKYIDKYRGKFDAGWDVTRQQWYERQNGIRHHPGRHRSLRRATPVCQSLDRTVAGREDAGAAPAGSFRRLPRAHR